MYTIKTNNWIINPINSLNIGTYKKDKISKWSMSDKILVIKDSQSTLVKIDTRVHRIDFNIETSNMKCILNTIINKFIIDLYGFGINIPDMYNKIDMNIIYLIFCFLETSIFNKVVNINVFIVDSIKLIGRIIILDNNSFSVVNAVHII